VTVLCQVFDLLAGPSPSGKISFERKQEYCFYVVGRQPLRTFGRFKTTTRTQSFNRGAANLAHEVIPLFRRLKFPEGGAQADAQRQNPALGQPDHGAIVAYVIGSRACDVAVSMRPRRLNQEPPGWSGNKSRPHALRELGHNHQVPIRGCEGPVLISLSAPPDRFASSARCRNLVAMKAAGQHHCITVTVMGAEVALGYTGTGIPPPGGSAGLQHDAIEFPEYTAVIVLAPCAS